MHLLNVNNMNIVINTYKHTSSTYFMNRYPFYSIKFNLVYYIVRNYNKYHLKALHMVKLRPTELYEKKYTTIFYRII